MKVVWSRTQQASLVMGHAGNRVCQPTKEGWRVLAVKQTLLLVRALTAFGFNSDLGMQSYLLWSLALPLQWGWRQQRVCGAFTPSLRVGNTPLGTLSQQPALSLSPLWLPALLSLAHSWCPRRLWWPPVVV